MRTAGLILSWAAALLAVFATWVSVKMLGVDLNFEPKILLLVIFGILGIEVVLMTIRWWRTRKPPQ